MRNPRGSGIAEPDPDQGYAGLTASCHSRRNRHPDRRTSSPPAAYANRGRASRHRIARRVVPGPAPLGFGSPDTRRGKLTGHSPPCFTLSYRDVEDLLAAERGLDISYETVRCWVLSPLIARRLRPRRSDDDARRVAALSARRRGRVGRQHFYSSSACARERSLSNGGKSAL
jgi:hypothetical protein